MAHLLKIFDKKGKSVSYCGKVGQECVESDLIADCERCLYVARLFTNNY